MLRSKLNLVWLKTTSVYEVSRINLNGVTYFGYIMQTS